MDEILVIVNLLDGDCNKVTVRVDDYSTMDLVRNGSNKINLRITEKLR